MKVVISDCSWNAYDVELANLPKDWEVVCAQIDHTDKVITAVKGTKILCSAYIKLFYMIVIAKYILKLIAACNIQYLKLILGTVQFCQFLIITYVK